MPDPQQTTVPPPNAPPVIDYDALAKQAGAVSSQPAAIDYDALAKQAGAVSSTPANNNLTPAAAAAMKGKINAAAAGEEEKIKQSYKGPASVGDEARSAWGQIKGIFDDMYGVAKVGTHLVEAGVEGNPKPAIKDAWNQIRPMIDEEMEHPEEGLLAPVISQFRPLADLAKTDPSRAMGQLEGMALLSKGPEAVNAVAKSNLPRIVGESAPVTGVRQFRGSVLASAEADALPPAAQVSPMLANTPREVLNHAHDIGMTLTPGEATERAVPRTIEAEGERAMATMNELQKQATANRATLFQSVQDLSDKLDPYKLGADDVTAGNAIKQSAKTAFSVARENANAAYRQVGIDQEDMAGDISGLKDFSKEQQFVRQPHAALTREVYQAPAVRVALDDIADAPDRVGKSPSIQSLRNLRTEFYEKANDYSGTIPQAAQHMYSQAEQITDRAIMAAAKGTPLEDSFRDASAQWAALKAKYDEPDTVLSTILQTDDPAKVTNAILSRKSAADIDLMRGENMDGALEALRRQVITRITRANFAVTKGSLGGFPDTFLRSLFEPADLKQLALKADIARRIKFQLNPSGTGNVLLGAAQLRHPIIEGVPLAIAGKMSMPREPLSFLPGGGQVPLSSLVNANPRNFNIIVPPPGGNQR